MLLTRRSLLQLAVTAAGAAACARREDPSVLRVGYQPSLLHAPMLTALSSGSLRAALPSGVRLDAHAFFSGPETLEALLGGSLDLAMAGPGPVLVAHARTRGRGLRVLTGSTSGGASLVARSSLRLRSPRDLAGRRVGTPQLGNTQDVALRSLLRELGLGTQDVGGSVTVLPMPSPELLAWLRRGELDAAFVPEPWVARMELNAGASVLLDERDLWPGRSFCTAMLVARTAWLARAGELAPLATRVLRAEVTRLAGLAGDNGRTVDRALTQLAGRGMGERVARRAWSRVSYTADPLVPTLRTQWEHAQSLGFAPEGSLAGLLTPLATEGFVA